MTSGEAWALLHERAREAETLRAELEQARKEGKRKASAPAGPEVPNERRANAGGVEVIVIEARVNEADELLDLSDRLKQQHSPAAVVLGARDDGRVHLVANFDRSLEGARRRGRGDPRGGGGRRRRGRGPPDDGAGRRARPERLGEALETAERSILSRLG